MLCPPLEKMNSTYPRASVITDPARVLLTLIFATPAWATPVPRRPKASAVASNAHKLLRLRPCMDSGSLAAHLA